MFKALGILMIVFSSFMFSYIKADNLKKRLENLKQLKRALSILKNEISFSSREIQGVAEELSEILNGDFKDVFLNISKNLYKNPDKTFGQAWEEGTKGYVRGGLISENAFKIIKDFSCLAGQRSKEIEIENIEKTINLLENEIKSEGDRFQENRKLIFSLGGITGLSLLIILL